MTYKKPTKLSDEDKHKELICAIVAWTLFTLLIIYKKNNLHILVNDFKNIWFIFWVIIIIVFTIICWHSNNIKLRLSSEKACVALLIAYLARLDMVFAAYFIIFIFSYYATDEII